MEREIREIETNRLRGKETVAAANSRDLYDKENNI